MGRKCSHCGNNGHNLRTCSGYSRGMGSASGAGVGLRLFGVQLDLDSPMKKSFSMECLCSSSSSSSPSSSLVSLDLNTDKSSNGYLSDGLIARTQEKKKGTLSLSLSFCQTPLLEEEHRSFLAGLERLGKGDWRGISRNFVTTRTPTQVASHAQKYFLRQSSLNKKKRRSSLFDMIRNDNRAGHITDWKVKSSSFSCKFPLIPALPSWHESSTHLIDLNSSSELAGIESASHEMKQLQTTLPSSRYPVVLARDEEEEEEQSFDQSPAAAAAVASSSLGSASQALIISPSLTKPAVLMEPLNLELSIAAPSSLNRTKASQNSLLMMTRTSVF
ncbi:hypothetical protein ACLOJK_040065 [Asimina triloba]